jgi:hypothetical protein
MTAPSFITAASVRDYLGLNSVSSDSKYSDSTLGSNIRAASWTLERATGRFFGDRTQTLKFTTNGAAFVTIPGLRTVGTPVTNQGVTLTEDETFYLIPDSQQSGVYTGIQFRAFGTGSSGGAWWMHNPEWFDRNLDSYLHPGNRGGATSLPNDLVLPGSWGYTDIPEPILHATKVLAAFYTKRPDAILSGAITTPDGNSFDLSQFPVEVQAFIKDWRIGPWVYGL